MSLPDWFQLAALIFDFKGTYIFKEHGLSGLKYHLVGGISVGFAPYWFVALLESLGELFFWMRKQEMTLTFYSVTEGSIGL